MRYVLFVIIMAITGCLTNAYADNADRYVREAEYYQKKTDSYRREAKYYLKKAEGYTREAAYYTRKGKTSRAKGYQKKAAKAMDDYKTQLRYAANAEDKAADYLKRASRLLRE